MLQDGIGGGVLGEGFRGRVGAPTFSFRGALVRPATPEPPSPVAPSSLADAAAIVVGLPTPGSTLRQSERAVIQHALEETGGNVSAAARILGVDCKALERRMARHRLGLG